MRRFYHPETLTQNTPTPLNSNASHHIGRVLRASQGDKIIVFDGVAGEWLCQIEHIDRKAVSVIPLEFNAIQRTPPVDVSLAIPLVKGERMDYAIQKATEMGVSHIELIHTRYTDVRMQGERLTKKLSHWQQVMISACEQCGLNRLPSIDGVSKATDWFTNVEADLKLIAHPGKVALNEYSQPQPRSVALAIGPEGGFTDEEVSEAQQSGFYCVTLGNRILRAETAPVALLGAFWTMWEQ